MDPNRPLPQSIQTLADVAALEAAAQLARTPCGEGEMVWHSWGDGTPVVLLHGGSGSWNHWVRNIGALVRDGRKVYVPDLPGFGDSPVAPNGRDADALPPWVEAGIDALIGPGSFDLVGFSFGGLVAGLLAARCQGRVRRLIVVGAPALTGERMRPVPLRSWEGEPPGPKRDAIHRHNLARLMLARESSIDEVALRLHAANLERDRMRRRRLHQTDLLLRTMPDIACPVAGIWGAQDALYRDRTEVIGRALEQAPHYRGLVFIPHAGHWVQYEDAQAFDAALRQALEMPLEHRPSAR